MYKLVALDLDGTLVMDRRIAPEAKAAIQRYQAAGGCVTVATGRSHATARTYLAELGIQAPAIVCNGARIVDPLTGAVLLEQTLEPATARTLIAAFASAAGDLVVYAGGESVVARRTPGIRHYEEYYGVTVRVEPDLVRAGDLRPNKLLHIGDVETAGRIWESVRREISGVETVLSGATNFEVLPAGVSKATGLRQVAEWLGFGMESVLAVGDHMNDLEMLRTAGLGAAVANATPDLQRAARYVATGVAGLGVAEILERFCLQSAASAQ